MAFGEDAAGRVLVVQLSAGRWAASRAASRRPPARGMPRHPAAGAAGAATPLLIVRLGGALRQRPLLSGNVGVQDPLRQGMRGAGDRAAVAEAEGQADPAP